MKKVGIIVGSVRPNRRSMQVANWLKVQLKKSTKVQFDIIVIMKSPTSQRHLLKEKTLFRFPGA